MIDEYKIIEDPDIVNEINNIVIKPESEDSLAYKFCESALEMYLETGDEEYLNVIVDEDAHKRGRMLDRARNLMGKSSSDSGALTTVQSALSNVGNKLAGVKSSLSTDKQSGVIPGSDGIIHASDFGKMSPHIKNWLKNKEGEFPGFVDTDDRSGDKEISGGGTINSLFSRAGKALGVGSSKSDSSTSSKEEKGSSSMLPATLDSVKKRFIPPKVDLGSLGKKDKEGIFKGLPIVGSSNSSNKSDSSVTQKVKDAVDKVTGGSSSSSSSSSSLADKVGQAFSGGKKEDKKESTSSSVAKTVKNAASSVANSVSSAASSAVNNGGEGTSLKKVGIGVGAVAGVAGSVAIIHHILKQSENKPKSWIARKIAALRNIYSKWLEVAKKQSDAGKANILKSAAAKVLQVIDALLAKMQKLSDRH